jgi:hypothetical protein
MASMCVTVWLLWPETASSASTSCSICWLACTAKRWTSTPLPASERSIRRATTWFCSRDLRLTASKLVPSLATASRIRSRVRSISCLEPLISVETKVRSSSSTRICSRTIETCLPPVRETDQAKAIQAPSIATIAPHFTAVGQSSPTASMTRRVSATGAAIRISTRESIAALWKRVKGDNGQ